MSRGAGEFDYLGMEKGRSACCGDEGVDSEGATN